MAERRSARRNLYDDHTRITLLEDDADDTDSAIDHLRDEMKAQTRVLMGILVSVATAAVLLAINIVVQAS